MEGRSKSFRSMTTGTAAVLAVCLMACYAGGAQAATVDYTLGSETSTTARIWSAGGVNSTIVGEGIVVKDVLGLSTPANSGVTLPFSNALFAFTSGTFSNSSGNLYTYGSGGAFNVKGSFDLNNNGTLEANENNVTLLAGSIGALTLDKSSSTQFKITSAELSVTDYALASYFGYPVTTLFNGMMNLAFNVSGVPDAFQGGDSTNGGISTSPVPVPAAALLMFSGLAGLFGFRRKASDVLGAVG